MQKTPKSLRLQLGLFGRTNVGKSSFLNMVAGQDVAITSEIAGTTTDVVEKVMELLPLGPVVFHDTAGLDDTTELGAERIRRTKKVFDRADIIIILCEQNRWGDVEEDIVKEANERKLPVVIVVTKVDQVELDNTFIEKLKTFSEHTIAVSSTDSENREKYLEAFKTQLIRNCPEDFITPPPLVGDLLPSGGLAMMIVPIDVQAPKGRLILPQVQTIRDILDNDAMVMTVKEREFSRALQMLNVKPDLVVCDSQVVMKMVADTPKDIPCTTFSILFSRLKGDLQEMTKGAAAIELLEPGDKILIAESCTHHAACDDIGRVKIPRWLRQYVGMDLDFDVYSGRDYPEDLSQYKLILHCGSCMHNRREMLSRIHKAKQAGVPITNYGIAISLVQGVLKRALSPFPAALEAFEETLEEIW